MTDTMIALRYIFILSLILILVAYWAGTQRVGETFGQQLVNLIYAGTGRTSSGTFAAYPTNAPSGTGVAGQTGG